MHWHADSNAHRSCSRLEWITGVRSTTKCQMMFCNRGNGSGLIILSNMQPQSSIKPAHALKVVPHSTIPICRQDTYGHHGPLRRRWPRRKQVYLARIWRRMVTGVLFDEVWNGWGGHYSLVVSILELWRSIWGFFSREKWLTDQLIDHLICCPRQT